MYVEGMDKVKSVRVPDNINGTCGRAALFGKGTGSRVLNVANCVRRDARPPARRR
jgi:hypothetical protein